MRSLTQAAKSWDNTPAFIVTRLASAAASASRAQRPLYVIAIDARKNQVVVGQEDDLLSREFTAAGVNWMAFDEPADSGARRSAGALPPPGRSRRRSQRSENDRVRVIFDEPQRAITPGQATVFYRGDEVWRRLDNKA